MLPLQRAIRSSGATIQLSTISYSALSRSWGRNKKPSNEAGVRFRRFCAWSAVALAVTGRRRNRDLPAGLPFAVLHRDESRQGRATVQDGEIPVDGNSRRRQR